MCLFATEMIWRYWFLWVCMNLFTERTEWNCSTWSIGGKSCWHWFSDPNSWWEREAHCWMEEAGYGAQASGSTAGWRCPQQKSKLLNPKFQHKSPCIMSYNITIRIVFLHRTTVTHISRWTVGGIPKSTMSFWAPLENCLLKMTWSTWRDRLKLSPFRNDARPMN